MNYEGSGLRTGELNSPLLNICRGKGAFLYDNFGRPYFDLSSSYSVNLFGHCHPKITSAIKEQVDKLVHCPPIWMNTVRERLGQKICSLSPFVQPRLIWSVLGTQAVEVALNIAYSNTKRSRIVVFEGGYHGKSNYVAPLNSKGYMADELGLSTDHVKLPFPLDPAIHKRTWDQNSQMAVKTFFDQLSDDHNFCAVLVEPVQGSSGVRYIDPELLKYLRRTTHEKGIFLIYDEIQSGFFRTGPLWAHQRYNTDPDLLILGKSLGGELPVSVVIGEERNMNRWSTGLFSSTFLTNALAHRAALSFIELLEELPIRDLVFEKHELIQQCLSELESSPNVREVRGTGLFWGVEMVAKQAEKVANRLQEEGILVALTGIKSDTLRISPPIVAENSDLEEALNTLVNCCMT